MQIHDCNRWFLPGELHFDFDASFFSFAIVRGSISATEVARYLEAANRVVQDSENYRKDSILNQWVNVWRLDCVLKELTLHPQIASFAEQLAEAPLRLWHDQLLIKNPNSRAPTEFHQVSGTPH